MDRQTWKAIQLIMSDSQKFAEALHGVSWEEGLSDDIVRSLEPFFAKNELGELGKPMQTSGAKARTPPGKNSPLSGMKPRGNASSVAFSMSSRTTVLKLCVNVKL